MTKHSGPMDEALEMMAHLGSALDFAVVGAGNGGLTFAGLLGMKGHEVKLYNRTPAHLEGVRWNGGIRVDGEVSGFGPVRLCTSSMAEALEGAHVIMVTTPALAHRNLAALMAPCLQDGQVVVLNPGRTGGALEFLQELKVCNCKADVLVAEAQTLLFATRARDHQRVTINRIKESVPLACIPSWRIPALLSILKPVFPSFVAGTNVLATSMENIGAVFHPVLTLLNAGWIESSEGAFQFYLDGISPSTAKVLEAVDAERIAVAEALGVRTVTTREWLYLSYGSSGRTLHDAIKSTDAYRGIMAPSTTHQRYVEEDVPMSLVPISSLGAHLGVAVPAINMVIDLACIMHGTDYRKMGRTVESLGLGGMSLREIRSYVSGEQA